jgi:hypothetical protein
MGMLSVARIRFWQEGQCDLGDTTDSCRGRRPMQTLRKLPKARPASIAKMEMSTGTLKVSIWGSVGGQCQERGGWGFCELNKVKIEPAFVTEAKLFRQAQRFWSKRQPVSSGK